MQAYDTFFILMFERYEEEQCPTVGKYVQYLSLESPLSLSDCSTGRESFSTGPAKVRPMARQHTESIRIDFIILLCANPCYLSDFGK